MRNIIRLLVFTAVLCLAGGERPAFSSSWDIRGQWVGDAQGTIFSAKGSVTILEQNGEDIFGIVEGKNIFGSARFGLKGKVRGNYIIGSNQGHIFEGFVYPDGTIRGVFRSPEGDRFNVFLQRTNPYWSMPPSGWQ